MHFDLDLVLKIVALLGGAAAFASGLLQYMRSQRWKRAEWVAQEVRAFFADPLVAAATRMIDWGGRTVQLFPDKAEPKERIVYVDDNTVTQALMYHGDRVCTFTETEAAIRDAFDRFLDGLEKFDQFIESGLVSADEVRPYLAYWIHHIRSTREGDPTTDRLVQLRKYIEAYGFRGVQRLFSRFRHVPLLPKTSGTWYEGPQTPCSAEALGPKGQEQ